VQNITWHNFEVDKPQNMAAFGLGRKTAMRLLRESSSFQSIGRAANNKTEGKKSKKLKAKRVLKF
jgi:5'-3' exonuclease